MNVGARVTLLLSLALPLLGVACSSSSDTSRFANTGGGSGNGGGSSGGSGTKGSGGQTTVISNISPSNVSSDCGNSKLDTGEDCDDGNTKNGDGCNKACRVEADYECLTVGQPCTKTSTCGDGKLASTETCDDGNTKDGDGCSADCKTVEDGWQCRVGGQPCVPLCGDGKIIGSEQCDDNNTDSNDGCSSTCQLEPGWTCDPLPCIKSVCGNAKLEAGELCDKGDDNGLFYGDGSGCSKTCTPEPTCRDKDGTTRACDSACGDGNIDSGEDCDDGNRNNGDGCSSECKNEDGFSCKPQDNVDTQDCSSGTGKCLILPITYRDFNGEDNKTNGHPDFFFYGATGPGKSAATTCVPNASGHPDSKWSGSSCSSNDSTDLCSGLVTDTLGSDGTPAVGSSTSCKCRFTDWDTPHVLSSTGTGITSCTVTGDGSSRNRIETTVKVIQSADSFKQWYHDSDKSKTTVGKIELAQVGTSSQYQFAGSTRTIYDDLHDVFLGKKTTAKGLDDNGFFPLDDADSKDREFICNIWPYWETTLATNCSAANSQAIGSQWDPRGWYSDLNGRPTGCSTDGTGCPGGPVPGCGATKNTEVLKGKMHNFYFTSVVRYYFKYAGGEKLAFFGDDGVWVFINGKLALDLGAPHERLQGSVTLSGSGAASTAAYTIQAQDVVTQDLIDLTGGTGKVTGLNLEEGKIYEIAVFHADQHPRESNYQLTLSGYTTTRTTCEATCGDGVQTATEECDCGNSDVTPPDRCAGHNNDDSLYGGCTTKCKLGPFCGDSNVDTDGGEECDDGTQNNHGTYGDMDSCTPTCKRPHHCGDGIIDTEDGEECDDGGSNGQGACTSDCTFVTR